jgi:carbonic anhydrase
VNSKLIKVILVCTFLLLSGCGPERLSNDLEDLAVNETTASISSDLHPNVITSFNPEVKSPQVDATTYVYPTATVIGDVEIGKGVMVGPSASLRGDEGGPIRIGDYTNVQDGVVVHALETQKDGVILKTNMVEKNGKNYAVYIGDNVSLAHQSQVHGPALIENDVFVGMQAFVFKATIGKGCVLEPGCKVIGVTIPTGRYVPAGQVVRTKAEVDKLPFITPDYEYHNLNSKVVEVNKELSEGYKNLAQ